MRLNFILASKSLQWLKRETPNAERAGKDGWFIPALFRLQF